jgi:hypothetical protein
MSNVFASVANYGASYIASEGTTLYAFSYAAIYAAEVYALNRIAASLGARKPRGEGRGLEVNITDTGQAGFAIYGTVRVGGTNCIPCDAVEGMR